MELGTIGDLLRGAEGMGLTHTKGLFRAYTISFNEPRTAPTGSPLHR